MVLGRPGVRAKVRLTVYASPSANFCPDRVTPLTKAFKEFYNLLIVCLIVCYKDCFHSILLRFLDFARNDTGAFARNDTGGLTGLTAGKQHTDEDEFINVVKMPLAKAVELVLNGEIFDAKSVTAILMLERSRKEK